MSGTSLDGLDIALCNFEKSEGKNWIYKIIHAQIFKYEDTITKQLRDCFNYNAYEFCKFDRQYGTYIGVAIKKFLDNNCVSAQSVDFIASHGHTIFHKPEEGVTVQIGHAANIAAAAGGIPVIADFRSLDVALNGQGAPLVPIGDQLLFQNYEICINLGGFSGVSFDTPEDLNKKRIAFDVCPCNFVNNYVSQKHLGKEYDSNGEIGQTGTIDNKLLQQLQSPEYFQSNTLNRPKSLGKEWVDQYFIKYIDDYTGSTQDLLATLYEFQAQEIAKSVKYSQVQSGTILVTGGGALNKCLIQKIAKYVAPLKIAESSEDEINFKEALVFAFLGVLRIQQIPNCLQSVTGSQRDSCGGIVSHY